MDKKFLLLTSLTLLFFPLLVSADLIIPFSIYTFSFFPYIILSETLVFWLLANKVIKVPIGIWRLLLITLVANLLTSFLGTFIPLHKVTRSDLRLVTAIAFLPTVLIEYLIYIPFLRKFKITTLNLLYISFVVNLVSYTLLVLFKFI